MTTTDTIEYNPYTQQAVRMTATVRAVLEAPFPVEVIKSFSGKGGKEMRYIDVEVLEERVRQVDPDFARDVQFGTNGVAVHYTILGVRRGDGYDNDDESNPYGRPQVNALARACRRSLRLFGVGASLWDEDTVPTPQATTSTKASTATRSANGLSEAQQNLLRDHGVSNAAMLTLDTSGGRESSASKIISLLMAAKKSDKDGYRRSPATVVREFYNAHRNEEHFRSTTSALARTAVGLFAIEDSDTANDYDSDDI